MKIIAVVLSMGIWFSSPFFVFANDAAGEVGVGGIQLRKEQQILMQKECLFINQKKIKVEYEFKNESSHDIETEIAFPIPEYGWQESGWASFDDFTLTVDGNMVPFSIDVHAFYRGKDCTSLLRSMNIEIATFGNWDWEKGSGFPVSQMMELPAEKRLILAKEGIVDPPDDRTKRDDCIPRWVVRKVYHWNQRFPAQKIIKISHEYTPKTGFTNYATVECLNDGKGLPGSPGTACADGTLIKALNQRLKLRGKREGYPENAFGLTWVKYILTTANTWKTPIYDFQLTVERDPGQLMTFCWDGLIQKVSTNKFYSKVNNFVPDKELTVYFIDCQ